LLKNKIKKKFAMNKLNKKSKNQQFKLAIVLITLLLGSVLAYGIYGVLGFTAQQRGQLHAVHEIKVNIIEAHLWLEDIIAGDTHKSFQKVRARLGQALWLSSALLAGGQMPEGMIYPFADFALQQESRIVQNNIESLHKKAWERLKNIQTSGVGSPAGQEYDALFKKTMAHMDSLEVKLWVVFNSEVRHFMIIQGSLLFITLALFLSIGLMFRRYESRRVEELQKAQQKIVTQFQELTLLNNLSKKVSTELRAEKFASLALDEIFTILSPDIGVLYLHQGDDLVPLATKSASVEHAKVISNHVVGQCLCGFAALGEKVYSNNIFDDHRCTLTECKDAGVKSFAALPLMKGDNVIGVLGIAFIAQRNLDGLTVFFESLADQISIGLQNCILYERQENQTERLQKQFQIIKLSSDIGVALTKGKTLSTMLFECCELLVKHLDAAFTRVWLIDETKKTLILQASAGMYSRIDGKHRQKTISSDNKIGNIALTKSPHLTNNIIDDPQVLDQEWVKRERMVAFAGYPLMVDDEVIGVIAMFSQKSLPNMVLKSLASAADEIALGVHRKLADSALIASETKFRDLIEDTVDWIWEVNGKGIYTYCSPRVLDLLGYHPDEVVGKTPFDFMPAAEAKKFGGIFQEIIAKQEPFNGLENKNIHKDGSQVILETSARPILDAKGKLCGFRGIDRDITERKTAEEALRQRDEQLRQAQKMESIGTLAGGIAHDFNNILTSIIGYADLAKLDMDNHESLANDINEVRKAADRATSLVRQILTFSRKSEQEKHALQVSLVVKEALKMLRSSIPSIITIKQDIDSESLVLADPTKIHQIIMNLCTNAYHAMRESGGVLDVSLRDVEISDTGTMPDLQLPAGKYLQLSVSDTGKGMDSETKEKIFEPYFTTKKPGEGTGLGMAVVLGVVESHDGRINVYSEPEQGTTFHVYLPVYEGESDKTSVNKQVAPLTGGNEMIMLVDDETTILDMESNLLKKYGYSVDIFTNAVQALQEFQQQPDKYNLVITDMTMPHMTGTQLSQQLLETRADIPIILCTGHSELTNREKSLAMGIKEYLKKPLGNDRLIRTARQVLDNAAVYGRRVLFVDDVQFNVDLGKLVLGRLGCKVTVALSGQQALDLFSSTPNEFDIIVTDLNMPNMTGLELAKKSLAVRPNTPILLLTGDEDVLDEKSVKSGGILEILSKPLDADIFVAALSRATRYCSGG